MHIKANPVFTGLNIGTRVTQLRQHGVEGIRLRIAADDFTAGDCRCDQEGPGFDAVRQNAIDAAAQTLYAFNGNAVGALAFNFRAQRNEEVGRIDDFRLTRGRFSITVVPSASVAALMMVTVAPTLTLSITICAPLRRPLTDALT
nr:Uncharacterised protein [Raoultella sp. NCTC 9187]